MAADVLGRRVQHQVCAVLEGPQITGGASVESTTSSAPLSCAMSASRGRSAIAVVGLAIVSAYRIRVGGPHRRADRVEVGHVHELGLDPEPRQDVAQQAVGSPDKSAETNPRNTIAITPFIVKNAAFSRRKSRGDTMECS